MCNLPWTVGNIFLVAYYSKSKKQNALYIETTSDRQHLFQIYRCIKLPWIKWCSTSTDGLFTSESRECFHFFFFYSVIAIATEPRACDVTWNPDGVTSGQVPHVNETCLHIFSPLPYFHFYFLWCIYVCYY